MPLTRSDGRMADESRPVTITPGYLDYAEGSALITQGNTAFYAPPLWKTASPDGCGDSKAAG